MPGVQDVEVGDYLAELMGLVLRASPGPFEINSTAAGTHEVTVAGGGRLVATFARQVDADLFAQALSALRAETAVLIEALGQHHDDGTGVCAQDGQVLPCTTRRIFTTQLTPRAAAS